MAFNHKNLSVIAYANGFTLYHYTTEDKLDDVLNEEYFGSVVSLINPKDMFILNCGDQNCIMFVKTIEGRKVKLG